MKTNNRSNDLGGEDWLYGCGRCHDKTKPAYTFYTGMRPRGKFCFSCGSDLGFQCILKAKEIAQIERELERLRQEENCATLRECRLIAKFETYRNASLKRIKAAVKVGKTAERRAANIEAELFKQ